MGREYLQSYNFFVSYCVILFLFNKNAFLNQFPSFTDVQSKGEDDATPLHYIAKYKKRKAVEASAGDDGVNFYLLWLWYIGFYCFFYFYFIFFIFSCLPGIWHSSISHKLNIACLSMSERLARVLRVREVESLNPKARPDLTQRCKRFATASTST